MKFKGTLIVVKDCNKALKFYQDMFGFELIRDNDGNMDLFFANASSKNGAYSGSTVFGIQGASFGYPTSKVNMFKSVSKISAFVDCQRPSNGTSRPTYFNSWNSYSTESDFTGAGFAPRHSGKLNSTFLDGHVDSITPGYPWNSNTEWTGSKLFN